MGKSFSAVTFLIFLLLLIPSTYQLPQIAVPISSFYITAFEILTIALFVMWVFSFLFLSSSLRKKTLFGPYVFVLLVLYSLYILVGLFNLDATHVLGDFRQYMPLVLYFPLINYYNKGERIASLRKAVFAILIIVPLYVIIGFVFFNNFLLAHALKDAAAMIGDRIFFDNNLFVFFAYLGYMLVIAFNPGNSLSKRVLFAWIISLNSMMLVIMQFRTFWAMLVMVFALSFFSMRSFFGKFKYAFTITASLLFFLSSVYLVSLVADYKPAFINKIENSIYDRVGSFADLGQVGHLTAKRSASLGTVDTRIVTAKAVLKDYIAPNWLFGVGFGGQLPMVNVYGEVYTMKYQIDNGYLTIIAKFGLFGFLIYLLFSVKIVRSIFTIMRSNAVESDDRLIAESFLYAIIAMVFGSMFSSDFIREQVCILGFLIMLCEIEWIHMKYKLK